MFQFRKQLLNARRRSPYSPTEDGGAARRSPSTYTKYRPEKYMRRDHPNAKTTNSEARNIPIGAEFTGTMSESRGTEKVVAKDLDSQPPHVPRRQAMLRQKRELAENVLWSGTVLRRTDSDIVKHFRNIVTNESYRTKRRTLLVTGRRVIEDLAKKMKVYPKLLMVRKDKPEPDVGSCPRMDVVQAEEWVMEAANPGNDGYIGEYDMPLPAPKEILFASPRRMEQVLVLDNVNDPSTLGSLMRTATALAYDAVVMTNHCADLYDNRTVRAARGVHFQNLTQFFVLREEDGDDTSELLNQMLEHHKSQPLVFSTHATASNTPNAVPLHQHRLDVASQHATQGSGGHTIFLGEDMTQNLIPKLQTRLRKRPKCLVLEEGVEDMPLPIAAPMILYNLRHTAGWEMLTPTEAKHWSPSTMHDSQRMFMNTGGVLSPPEPNIVGEENVRDHFHEIQQGKLESRYERYKKSDEDRWEEAEIKRIKSEVFSQDKGDPLLSHMKRTSTGEHETDYHDPRYPNFVKDTKPQRYSREDVRQDTVNSMSYLRPSQYGKYMRPPRAGT